MAYDEALEYIHSFGRFVKTPGLTRMQMLMEKLGNPQDALCYVHIAGTNGKGSTVAMVSSMLCEAGYKVGMYTSPYLFDFRERIQVDFQLIPKEGLVDLVEKIMPVAEAMKKQGEQFAEFEIITALGFMWFKQQGCDIVILETGLGGRLDATNIIKKPLVTAITSISLDHTKVLGNTPGAIAAEKCGIIKENGCTIAYPVQDEVAMAVIRNCAKDKKNTFIVPGLNDIAVQSANLEGTVMTYKGLEVTVPLVGIHQRYNSATALEIISALKKNGYTIEINHIMRGMAKTKWPGRVEVIRRNPTIIIDGSHNLSGIEALASVLENMSNKTIRVVFGMLQDKDYRTSLEKIGSHAQEILLVKPDHPMGVPVEILYPIAKAMCENVSGFEQVGKAIEQVVCNSTKEDVIVICGSLYLMNDAKKEIEKI